MTSSREQRFPRSDDDDHGGDISSGFGEPKRAGEPISDEKAAHMDLRLPGHEVQAATPASDDTGASDS